MRFTIRDDEGFIQQFARKGVWYCLDEVYYYRKEDTFLVVYIWCGETKDVFIVKRNFYTQNKHQLNHKIVDEFERAYKEGLRKTPDFDYEFVGDGETDFLPKREETENDTNN